MLYSTTPRVVTLTQAQYDALSTEDQNNGTIYMVSDAAALSQSIPCVTLTQDQYDALSNAEKTNGNVYFITDGEDEKLDVVAPVIYSETERIIGVWTDGKPLYEKTFVRTTGITTGSYVINHGIDNFEKCVYQSGYIKSSSTYCPFTRVSSDNANVGIQGVNSTVISTFINSAFENITEFAVTIRYTKTTDAPGSASWTPSGVPAHHYSTDERIVGTWIDGSTLYEKTITASNVTISTQDWQNIEQVSGIDKLVDATGIITISNGQQTTNGQFFNISVNSSNYVRFFCSVWNNETADILITIRYTKSSS